MRALLIGLIVLGLMGIALVEATFPANSINKVVIGVLDFETTGPVRGGQIGEMKKALMKELRRNTRVKLVDIPESCSLSVLKKKGYERAERYRMNYQLDTILYTNFIWANQYRDYDLGLIDLYTKQIRKVSIEVRWDLSIDLRFRGISKKLLPAGDLNRVLTAKKEASEKKEGTVPREVKETPEEIEGLIHNCPKLIAQGEYNQVLELIEDLPRETRRHVQVQTLECFSNLKGWVTDRDQSCKLSWVNLRQKLISSGDKEATPILVIFLRDEGPYLRLYAADLLSHIGDKRALKDLREVGENDENHKVRRYAKKAYEQISGEKF